MKMVFKLSIFFFCIICAASLYFLYKPSKVSNKSLYEDITFITQTLLENHPGAKNLEDPNFMKTLNVAHQEAIAQAKVITSTKEHLEVLKNYLEKFNDSHLALFANYPFSNLTQQHAKKHEFFMETLMPGFTWISLPAFWFQDSSQRKALESIISSLPKHRGDKIIIFDVRGNGGGSSAWGEKIIYTLFGQAYAEKKLGEWYRFVYADWRVSRSNLEHIRTLVETIKKQFGSESKELTAIMKLYDGMKSALKKGDTFYAEAEHIKTPINSQPKGIDKNLCKAKIVVLIDEGCFSSCLIFLEQLKALDHYVLFVGKPTKKANFYMDVRRVQLPSKLGRIQFPQKIRRSSQGSEERGYEPDIFYRGNIDDTPQLKLWLKKQLLY